MVIGLNLARECSISRKEAKSNIRPDDKKMFAARITDDIIINVYTINQRRDYAMP
jgi:hypothetical protein